MPEFMQLLETIRAEEATRERLYEKEGTSVRSLRRESPAYRASLAEAVNLWAKALGGSRRAWVTFQEAMTTSDFPLLFGDILDRQLLANYQETPVSWPNYIKRGTVRDFRTVSKFVMNGAEASLAVVPEETEYPARKLEEGRYQWAVQKRGARVPFSWEAMINDDLDALKDIPQRFARAARRTEERFAAELFVDANGPHASLYTVGNGNIVTGNPTLSAPSLEIALKQMALFVDEDGEPIVIEAVELVVPPALEITANQIMNTMERRITAGAEEIMLKGNGLPRNFRVSVNHYIPSVVTAGNDGSTSWYLFANPNSGRPALEMDFLRGHETPEIFMKSPNAVRVGGGAVDPMDGDFDTDSIQYKVRQVLGGGRLDPKSTVASEGDGS